jgi:putative DNA methylase
VKAPVVRKKLIEVALPLEAINKASAREKSIRHGHPSTLHLWWARRPLAAARAVIFAQMVDDPAAYVDVLRADPKLRRKAETVLKARLKLWEEARALAEKTKGTGLAVPEPGPPPTLDDMLADEERQRLFRIIENLVLWENTTNETVLKAARDEIWASWRRACVENADHPQAKELFDRKKLPAFHDPFAGGGALPLEAQRLGLESYASDLNPVAVLINKAMIEIPPKFAGRPPVNPEARKEKSLIAREWKGAQGLAEDVRYYGQWMRGEAEKRIGHLYPKVEITAEMAKARSDLKPYVGRKLTVIAWLWARTVKSPNPAFARVEVPLVTSFILGTKPGKEAFIEPVLKDGGYSFTIRTGKPRDEDGAHRGTKLSRGANFRCIMSGTPITPEFIKAEGIAGRMGARMMAIVAEGERGRVYLPPTEAMEAVAGSARPEWKPETQIPADKRSMFTPLYGLTHFHHLFSPRQLVALTTFSDLVQDARERVKHDARTAGMFDDKPLASGGTGVEAYSDAVGVYLALSASKAADNNSTICSWMPGIKYEVVRNTFARQTLPMSWDYAESNPFAGSSGDFFEQVKRGLTVFEISFATSHAGGRAAQADAQAGIGPAGSVISTDPPYYDNIGYADLADFFYVWLRRSLKPVFPDLFATVAVPKAEELVASPYRHGNKQKAEEFFLVGMTRAMHRLAEQAHPAFPVTIYYAFKQSETDRDDDESTSSTGWDTFLEAVLKSGLAITGTWPMRTERSARSIGIDSNALASSIILVCRPRGAAAPTATRREYVSALKAELPVALAHLQRGNIAPVDLAQAAIGPGMAVYTRYAKVLDAEGKSLAVREALALINQTLDEALAEQEGDFDGHSRFALGWFEQYGFGEGEFGVADVLARAKVTAVEGLVEAGIVRSGRGKVRLLKPDELDDNWDPATDSRLTAWEIVHHLIRVLASGGEGGAARLVTKLGAKAELARELAYRLYTLCERKKRAAEGLAYNGLVQSWPEIVRLAREGGKPKTEQAALFGATEE